MTVIKMGGGDKQYFSYKQGYWFDKSVQEGEENYSVKTLLDKDRKEIQVGGQFETAIGGMITGLAIKNLEADGRKFSVLEVDIDGSEKLSMSVSSPAAHAIMETFENLDFTQPVVLLAWTNKGGYNKLSIKQNGAHVKNSFVEFTTKEDGSFEVKHLNGYPERVSKDASDSQKTIARATKQEFLEKHFNEKVVVKVPTDAPTDEDGFSGIELSDDDDVINPEDIPF